MPGTRIKICGSKIQTCGAKIQINDVLYQWNVSLFPQEKFSWPPDWHPPITPLVLVKNQNAYPLHLHVRKPPCKWNWIVVVGWCKWGWWHRHHIGHAQATSWWWTARWTNFLEKLPTRYRLSFDFRSQMRNYVRFLNGTYSLNQSQLGSGDLAVSEEYSRQSWFPSRWWPTIPLPGDFSLFGCFRFCLDARTFVFAWMPGLNAQGILEIAYMFVCLCAKLPHCQPSRELITWFLSLISLFDSFFLGWRIPNLTLD